MKISVIIPSRDRSGILPHTLQSLAQQSLPVRELEVVVVDDGSADETPALLRAAKYPFHLVCERLPRRDLFCPARARNCGLRAAAGEVVLFLDVDVLAAADLVVAHLAAHREAKGPTAVSGYTCGFPLVPAERTPEALNPPPPEILVSELPRLLSIRPKSWEDGREAIYAATGDLVDHPAPWALFWTNNASVSRRLALECGGFDEEFVGWGAEDLEFAYRLHQRGVRFTLARAAWGVHYPHPVGEAAERSAQLERNRRRLISAHPGPKLELWLWSGRTSTWVWNELSPQLAQTLPVPVPGPAAPALLRRLRGALGPGSVLWHGPLWSDAEGVFSFAAWCQPFEGDVGTSSSTAKLPLLGVFTPWEAATFPAAVVADYWRCIPLPVLKGLLRELGRTSSRTALLFADGPVPEDARLRFQTPEQVRVFLKEFVGDSGWEEIWDENVGAFLIDTHHPSAG